MRVRVAIVDDTPDLRMLLRLGLEREPAIEVVAEGSNGRDAVQIAADLKPDVMLLDLAMPVMDGMTALPLIRRQSPGTEVLVLSGFTADAMTQKAMAAGARCYVQKGVAPQALCRTVLEIADLARREAASASSADDQPTGQTQPTDEGDGHDGRMHPAATAAEKAPVGLLVARPAGTAHDAAWRIDYVNDSGRLLLGVDADIVGRELLAALPNFAQLRARAGAQWARDHETTVSGVVELGSNRLDVVLRQSGPDVVMGLHRRVSTSESEAVRLRKAIATTAHEIRNPVTVLAGVAATLEEDIVVDPDRRRDLLAAVRRQSAVLERVTDDLLTAAQARHGSLRVDVESVRLLPALQAAVSDVLEGEDVHVDGPDLHVLVDPTRLAQMMLNLLSNAKKYGAPPFRVEVSAPAAAGELVQVAVADHGDGVPEEFRGRLFHEYARAEHVGVRGSGLGLFVVRSLAEVHGGDVDYCPGPLGGAVFTLSLPPAPRSR